MNKIAGGWANANRQPETKFAYSFSGYPCEASAVCQHFGKRRNPCLHQPPYDNEPSPLHPQTQRSLNPFSGCPNTPHDSQPPPSPPHPYHHPNLPPLAKPPRPTRRQHRPAQNHLARAHALLLDFATAAHHPPQPQSPRPNHLATLLGNHAYPRQRRAMATLRHAPMEIQLRHRPRSSLRRPALYRCPPRPKAALPLCPNL